MTGKQGDLSVGSPDICHMHHDDFEQQSAGPWRTEPQHTPQDCNILSVYVYSG